MGRVSYPAIGETSDHPDVDRQSKPHNFRFSHLLFVKPTQPPHPSHNATAFYAYLSSDVAHPGQGQILKFDPVKTNAGNGYHPNSGVFIAPETGYYVFSWTSRSNIMVARAKTMLWSLS
uniref:Heavy metal-binding protein HIP n=1 Tax=Magallana gigas TaxID=29159 RepID=K1S3U9_MAGGI